MINKIKKDIKRNYIIYIFFIIILLCTFIKLNYEIYSPGSLEDLTDRIKVEDPYESKGSFNLTYVSSRSGTITNILLSYIIPSWDLISLDESRVEDESEKEIIERNKIYLKETSYNAIIAAFKEANIDYEIESINLTVSYVYNSSNTDIRVGDIIKSVNGVNINTFEDLSNEISKYKENDEIKIGVLRNNKSAKCYSKLQIMDDKLVIGLTLAELKNVKTNPKVEYVFKNNESGASRGLMCALDIYNKITEYDLTKGRIISGTGSIDENGNVGTIDGVKYKLKGAAKKKADIFIVPSKNYEEAIKLKEKNNYDIEIIEANTLKEVIKKLKE